MRFSSVAVALCALVSAAAAQGGSPDAYAPGWNDVPAGPAPLPEFTNNIGQCETMLIAWSGSVGDVKINFIVSQGDIPPQITVKAPAISTPWQAKLPEGTTFSWELQDDQGVTHGVGPSGDNHFTVTAGTTDCM